MDMAKFAFSMAFACLLFVSFPLGAAHSADGAPVVSMFSLLEGFDYYPDSGWLRITNLEIFNLPEQPYSEYGDHKLWAIIRTAEGVEKYKINMQALIRGEAMHGASPYSVEPLTADGQLDVSYFLLDKPGNYAVDFYADGTHFYTFPFSIRKAPAPSGGEFLYLEGDWNKLACISYDNADPEENLKFHVWLRNTVTTKQEPDFKAKVFNRNGGALVCVASFSSVTLRSWWTLSDTYFFTPPAADGSEDYFYAKDLLKSDGSYVIKLYIGGDLYGEYNFSVSGGKFSRSGRMAQDSNPLFFVGGENSRFWYEKA